MTVLPSGSALELIKLQSTGADFYLRSDSNVTGFYYNPKASVDALVEFSNVQLNENVTFTDSTSSVDVYVLLYSVVNVDNLDDQQKILNRLSLSSRILETEYSGTTVYISENEMGDDFSGSTGMAWYIILLIILGALLVLILLIFCISFCCCQDEDDINTIAANPEKLPRSNLYDVDIDGINKPIKTNSNTYLTRDSKSDGHSGFSKDV